MATKEAVAQLAALPERVGILETKVENINEKLVDLKIDVKDMHDCLDRTRDGIMDELKVMSASYESNRDQFYAHMDKLNAEQTAQHNTLAAKLADLEKTKHKFMLYAMAGLAFIAGAGWIGHPNLGTIVKFLGL